MSNLMTVELSQDEALVLFEFFARFSETNEFRLKNNAEFVAFSKLAGQLEAELVAPFQANYDVLLEQAYVRLAAGFDGKAPGVE